MSKFDYTTIGNTEAIKNLCKILEEKNDIKSWNKILSISSSFFKKMKSLRNVELEHRQFFQKLCLSCYFDQLDGLQFHYNLTPIEIGHFKNFLTSYYRKELMFDKNIDWENDKIKASLVNHDLDKPNEFDNMRFEGE